MKPDLSQPDQELTEQGIKSANLSSALCQRLLLELAPGLARDEREILAACAACCRDAADFLLYGRTTPTSAAVTIRLCERSAQICARYPGELSTLAAAAARSAASALLALFPYAARV